MNYKSKNKEVYRLSLVNFTMLAQHDKEKCQFCGRFGCTDRGYTVTSGLHPDVLSESEMSQQVIEKLDEVIGKDWLKDVVRTIQVVEPKCVRQLKKSNAETMMAKIQACGNDCRRNDNPCPYRGEESICQINVLPNGKPLTCLPDDEEYFDCPYHEKAFSQCQRRIDGQCADLMEKYNAPGKKDVLVLLSHRFSVAPCRFNQECNCTNNASAHYEGACTLQGLMATCEQYAPVSPDQQFTEGVCTYVSSKDGKDDRVIFPSSDYARGLSKNDRDTLCMACRISHNIARVTGLKCLGVRRSSTNPFLNNKNPLVDHSIQINYLYLTNPEDVAKFDPEILAQSVYDALVVNCEGIQCEEYQSCHFNPI